MLISLNKNTQVNTNSSNKEGWKIILDEKQLGQIYKFIDENKEEIINLYKDIVNIESCGMEKDSVNTLAHFLKLQLEREGFKCKLVDVGPNGNSLVGILGEERAEKPVIFSGHMDTVFPKGTYGENPFKIIDGKAYGPGVLDMKGGIVIALYVIKALNSAKYKEKPIKVIFSGDEEINHSGSRGAQVIMDEAKGGLCAFNMETGTLDKKITIGRKGNIRMKITVAGVEAHAGKDFTSGVNSIEEMAHKIIEIHKLTNLELGTTLNVGTIKGGTVANAVPGKCEIVVDMRFENAHEMDRNKEKIEEICKKTFVKGTTTEYEYISIMDVFETTENGKRFHAFIKETAKQFGLDEVDSTVSGGGSDAAYITMAGVPTVCSCGVAGEWNHTDREYAVVQSIYDRIKLISTVIMNISSFEKLL